MSNSPFEIFRRNLKPLMVFLTGLALFAFVVLPVLDTYMRQGVGVSGTGVVARFGDTELTQTRVEYFTRNHQSTIRFLTELAQQTIARGGTPRVAGFQYDTQNNQVQSVGINQQPSLEGSIRTLMLSAEAQKNGFDLDDSTLSVWVEQFTDGMISNSDIDAMLMQSTQNQMGRPHLYEQLRNHLLANVYLSRGYAGLYMGDGPMSGPLMTPEEQWKNFLKLNRKAFATTYGVLVSDYLDQTDANPSEAEIQAVFDEGKDRDFNEQSPEPAFHRRYSAKFEYLVGNFQEFVDREVAELSEEEIRAEYERRLKGGAFQLPEYEAEDDAEEKPAEDADTKDSESKDSSTESAADDTDGDKPDDEPEPDSEPKGDAKESDEPTEDAPQSDSEGEPESDAGDETGNDEASESSESDQSSFLRGNGVKLVTAQEDEQAESDENAADESEQKSDASEDTTKEETAEKDSADTDSADTDGADTDGADTDGADTDEAKSDDAKSDEEKKSSDDEKSATKDDAADADDSSAKDDAVMDAVMKEADDQPAKKEEPKVESFEDVRDSLAQEMAGPAAQAKLASAISDVAAEMRLYFNKKSIHESNVSIGQGGDPPVKPDLKELADKYGLQYEIIGPHTEATIAEINEPIANSSEMGSQFGRRGPSFSVMMFGFNNGQTQLPPQPLFSPIRTSDGPAGKQYVSWKIEETEAYTPTLAEARDEVIMAIRMREARKLAQQAAEAIAAKASKESDKSLLDVVPDDKQDNVMSGPSGEGLGPFSWMESFGFAGSTIGNVPELDSVGDEFMKAVFNSEVGEYAVAMNQPERVVYVVKPLKFEPSLDELRQEFKQPTNRMMAMLLGNDSNAILREFYDAIDKDAGFVTYLDEQQ